MILPLQQAVRAALRDTLTTLYGPEAVPATLVVETPPTRALGDLALPCAFELARVLRKAPRAIAQEIVAALPAIPGVRSVQAVGGGYINVHLDRAAFLRTHLGRPVAAEDLPARAKTIVEHTAINPNKAAHIGHLRNAILGDTIGRLLRFLGTPVEIQNYIDDTGVQVADVVVGFEQLEGKGLDEVRALAAGEKFDYYCWDLYARVTEWYEADRSTRLGIRARTLHAIEHGEGTSAEMGAVIADAIVRCHLRTMARLGIDYDLLSWEGDILRLQFWATAFDILKKNGTVYLQTEGKLKGCWVMEIDEDVDSTLAQGEAADVEGPEGADADADGVNPREKVIVRSNGTVTYVGKDIANQFWKFGLLGKDFAYRPFATRLAGDTLWATTTTGGTEPHPGFGRAGTVINVIDTRQSYLQQLLKQALATMGHRTQAEQSIHFSYEMVALSHKTARELGYEADADGKPFVEVSGRKGLGVKADDLLDRLVDKALDEVRKRNAGQSEAEARQTAEAIAIAAVRYFMVKFSRTKIIAFDIDEALSFEGESGPYLQYAAVRSGNILAKLRERDQVGEDTLAARLASLPEAHLIEGGEPADALWDLVLACARLDETVEAAVRSLEPSVVAKYAFGLAQAFSGFYHKCPILSEEREDVRLWRAAAVSYFRQQMTRALDLMGAVVPGRM
ncbi:arginine--tRNA ligase [Luteitalea sp. TBR-22]|uniref:arginine--tRNA ligase n=1 Tax=Luteitalea sp. TBR-22 TaxID=2802971 RepID=UPI001AFC3A0B|nr:arginine--tRNA ligase [Luteitalea sp. TBR-22]BCS34175.1 arginine--tRNA ligase [Luteitalea sp. TBR-22]